MTTSNESGIIPHDINVLVAPDIIETKTEGGILRLETEVEKESYAQTLGTIVALGDNAFFDWGDDKPKVGGRVITAKYGGFILEGQDKKTYRLLCDKDIRASIDF